jgi:hypothetical protein
MFRRNIVSAIADLALLTDGNGKTGSTVGENPSAKGRLPEVYLLTKILLIYYKLMLRTIGEFHFPQFNPCGFGSGPVDLHFESKMI